ncbi:MAG: trehalose-phosphatase [Candidatus Omnitrophica bacterium]|nr:trehalose-phosphatase [Candidatus Omnitrophota bacterium]
MSSSECKAAIFDLDGVITNTATVHFKAWKAVFDEYLGMLEERDGTPFKEFTYEEGYLPFVDGKPRYEGVKSFLESRGIEIPYGEPTDEAGQETVCGIGNRKNEKFLQVIREDGVELFESSLVFIRELKDAGIRIGVASSSKNCKFILEAAGIEELFETRVDGVVSAELGLQGKPEGDIFVRAAANLGFLPQDSFVVEDATSGVRAGRNGGFRLVLGIAREGNTDDLFAHGADLVIKDLEEASKENIDQWFQRTPPELLSHWGKNPPAPQVGIPAHPSFCRSGKETFFSGKEIVFFLDYDGTLTPIVDRPQDAVISDEMRREIEKLAKSYTVAIVSGRMREDVESLAGIKDIFYAGSHGFDIRGPGFSMVLPEVEALIPTIDEIIRQLKERLKGIEGALIEEKKFSVAVHYRLVAREECAAIAQCVEEIVDAHPRLRCMHGKKVFEILPALDWNKGKAVRWIMKTLQKNWSDSLIVYIGDDTTDEDAFRVVRTRGATILVAAQPKPSSADFRISSPDEVKSFFQQMLSVK